MMKNRFMELALLEAELAYQASEIPVGCVIVDTSNNRIIARAHNLVQQNKNATSHAEILAISEACKVLKSKYLFGCNLYINLEPCIMCAAALSYVKIKSIYYGAANPKLGAIENGLRFFTSSVCHHRPEIYSTIMEQKSKEILDKFFKKTRANNASLG